MYTYNFVNWQNIFKTDEWNEKGELHILSNFATWFFCWHILHSRWTLLGLWIRKNNEFFPSLSPFSQFRPKLIAFLCDHLQKNVTIAILGRYIPILNLKARQVSILCISILIYSERICLINNLGNWVYIYPWFTISFRIYMNLRFCRGLMVTVKKSTGTFDHED